MRTKLSLFLASIVVLTLFAFIGCGDDEPGTTNFDTQEEAVTAWNGTASSQMGLAYQLALTIAQQGISFSGDFDDVGGIFLKKTKGFRKFNASMANGYQGNGLWTFDTTFTEEGTGDFDFHYEIDFDQYDANGYPNDQTNAFDYGLNLNWDFSDLGEGEGTFTYNYDVDLNVSGIQGYRAETGNAALNGNAGFGIAIETIGQQGQPSYDFEYSYKIKFIALTVAPGEDAYPLESGSIEFTFKYGVDPNIPGFEELNVKGKITFDGDDTAILEFGGFTFTIDLDTGEIVQA